MRNVKMTEQPVWLAVNSVVVAANTSGIDYVLANFYTQAIGTKHRSL